MFFENFIQLCEQINKSPTAVISELGISRGSVTHWKAGKVPHHATLLKIADYFGVTVDYLLGSSAPAPKLEPKAGTAFFLTAHEAKVLTAYRDQPEMQPAVDRILGVTEDGYVTVYTAANSTSNRKHTITKIPREKWEEIENAPNTDEDLL